jgi:hypothetical protein
LYEWESWPLAITDEHKLRVYKNMVLRRIFGPKRVEIIGGWEKLYEEELQNL